MSAMELKGWGERAERSRAERRRRHTRRLAAAAVLMVIGVPFFIGLYDGLTGAPPHDHATRVSLLVEAALTLLASAFAAYAAWHYWRAADEVERRTAANSLAMGGFVALAGFPLVDSMATAARTTVDMEIVWWLALATAGTAWVVQRRQG